MRKPCDGRCRSGQKIHDQGVKGGGAEADYSGDGQDIEGSGEEGFHGLFVKSGCGMDGNYSTNGLSRAIFIEITSQF